MSDTETGQSDRRNEVDLWIKSRLKAEPLPELDLSPMTLLAEMLGYVTVILIVTVAIGLFYIFWRN